MKKLRLVPALLLALTTLPTQATDTGVVMRDVYDAIAYLLPLSVRTGDDATPWDKELVDAKLEVLSSASATLVEHAKGQDREFSLLARSFDRLVHDISASFKQEWPDYAYYSLMELTDHCVACHSRLPSESQALFGQRLVARMQLDDVEPETKALLLVATRQFDAALDMLEKRLLEPELDPVEAEYRGIMVQYLRVAISTGNDLTRVAGFLDKYRGRDDLPYYLQRRLALWRKGLTRHAGSIGGTPNIARARQIFDHATGLSLAPGNRIRAVEDFIAARIMRTWLAAHPDADAATKAEIYFKLAIVALRTSEPEPAVPEMEMLLAAAVEADPKGPYAQEAYSILEEYGYLHEEHLARQMETRVLIDMAALRAKVGGPEPVE
ncbi:MAG: hypothetical protein KDK06_20110 [Gammaproteobacteria bacterium]|nr:hypothetical protein [Gammaproteobacteria bacterium]